MTNHIQTEQKSETSRRKLVKDGQKFGSGVEGEQIQFEKVKNLNG